MSLPSKLATSLLVIWAFVMAAMLGTTAPQAQTLGTGVIEQLAVQGNQRIEPATIRTYMTVREGDPFDPVRIDRSLKNLFATGLFADVAMVRQGNILVVRVVENPIINRISLEGNRRLDDDELAPEIQLRPRVVYTRTKVQQDVEKILDLYRRSGRFAVTVEPNVIELPQNRIDLVFEINEGEPTYVRRINFIGNQEYSDGDLRSVVLTREERWWRFLSSTDTYDPDRLTFDRELLRRHYLSTGYADFQVLSAVAELGPSRESFFITFTVDEGNRYTFGELDVDVSIPNLRPEVLRQAILAEKGSFYDATRIEDTIELMTDFVGAAGYAFVEIRPRITRNPDTRTIDIVFDVLEGPRVFVERVDITGNVRTLDEVIRREFLLVEGDAFNTAKLRRSRARIQNLAFFEQVEVENFPSEVSPDRTVIEVQVQEQPTGELSFGVGFSSTSGALFDVGIRERNLLGRGQDLRFNFSIAQQRTQIDLGFTEPYFLNRRVVAGVNLFAVEQDFQDESGFDTGTIGGNLLVGFNYNEYMFQRISYGLTWTRLRGISQFASQFVREQEGTTVTSNVTQNIAIDRRNNVIDPTDGWFIGMTNELAGLGGTEHYLRTDWRFGYYYMPFEGWPISLTGRVGWIIGLNDELRIFQRYQLGGQNLRGFDDAGVSPRDAQTQDALGGDWIATLRAELEIPLGLPEELGITPKLFSDWGTIGSPKDLRVSDQPILDSQKIRGSVGVGVEWESPVGPITIDWAYILSKEDFDETESFRVNFGQRF